MNNYDYSSEMDFKWNITSFNSSTIQFRLNFQQPLDVSKFNQPKLYVQLINNTNFKSLEGKQLDNFSHIDQLLPKYLSKQDQKAAEFLTSYLKNSIDFTFRSVWIKVLAGGALQHYFGLIRGFQFNVYLSLIFTNYPAHLVIFLSSLMSMA